MLYILFANLGVNFKEILNKCIISSLPQDNTNPIPAHKVNKEQNQKISHTSFFFCWFQHLGTLHFIVFLSQTFLCKYIFELLFT